MRSKAIYSMSVSLDGFVETPEICYLVGFESLGPFSSRFRKLVGVSPSDYRQSATAAGGPPQIPGCFVLMWTRPRGEN